MKKIIVLAGNYQQFQEYLANKGRTNAQGEYVYGSEPEKLYGVQAERVDVTGSFWRRLDAHILKELADSRVF